MGEPVRRRGLSPTPHALATILLVALAITACSPEATRRPGERGADPGNRDYPLPQLHGNQDRNNPSFETPIVGKVPKDAKGVPGFWARREISE